jgi:hypothetical protein
MENWPSIYGMFISYNFFLSVCVTLVCVIIFIIWKIIIMKNEAVHVYINLHAYIYSAEASRNRIF